jgi:alpha-ketoglutarate-dependent taurine dioxygenase
MSNTNIEVRPLSLYTGAEIEGVDLKQPLAPETVKAIWAALLEWKVIFFRGQHLDHAQHVAFARLFGEPTIGHVLYGHIEGFPEIYSVLKGRKKDRYQDEGNIRPWSEWHTDITTAINPPAASFLRGVTVPPYTGDTQWTNLVAAYDRLSAPMQAFLDTLRGIHGYADQDSADNTAPNRNRLATEHPLVRVHPETGEKVLFISPSFLKSIVGLSPRESQVLLEFLWEHAVRPEFTVRFKWREGDLAIWDNRATAHYAPTDVNLTDFPRQL